MGKTFSTGLLTNGIWQDASNNIGIGGSPSGSFKLDVTGTGRFTSGITGANLSLSDTVAITLSATDSRVLGGSSTGRLLLANSGTSTYGIFYGASHATAPNAISLVTDNTERLRITNTGNVGIGTSSPSYKLDVQNGSDFDIRLRDTSLGGTVGILFETANDFSGTSQAYIKGIGSAGAGTSQLIFGTAGASGDTTATERMRILSDGRVSIGYSSPTNTTLYVYGPLNNGNAFRAGNFFAGAQSAGSDYPAIGYNMRFTSNSVIQYEANDYVSYIYFGSGKIQTFTTTSTGTAGSTVSATTGPFVTNGGTTWSNGSSDVRLKKNFETTQGLAEILQIEPVKYHFNWEDDSATKRLGFKAQNLQPLIPEMVQPNGSKFEDGSDILTFTPDYLLPVLVKAIQELSAKVSALENKS